MKRFIIKELIIYFCLLIILAFMMHGSELPDRASALTLSSAWHPVVYSFVVYLVMALVRFIVYKLQKMLFRAKAKD